MSHCQRLNVFQSHQVVNPRLQRRANQASRRLARDRLGEKILLGLKQKSGMSIPVLLCFTKLVLTLSFKRALREALQKTIEEREEFRAKVDDLDTQLDLLQLENHKDGNETVEEMSELKNQLDSALKGKDSAEQKLKNALSRMDAMEAGESGNSAAEVLHYQQEAQQVNIIRYHPLYILLINSLFKLAELMDEQHSIIDELVKAKGNLESQLAKARGAKEQAEAIAEAATNEAAAAVAAAEEHGIHFP